MRTVPSELWRHAGTLVGVLAERPPDAVMIAGAAIEALLEPLELTSEQSEAAIERLGAVATVGAMLARYLTHDTRPRPLALLADQIADELALADDPEAGP